MHQPRHDFGCSEDVKALLAHAYWACVESIGDTLFENLDEHQLYVLERCVEVLLGLPLILINSDQPIRHCPQ